MLISLVIAIMSFVPAPAEPIAEDDPRWNCVTMGNKVCGPDALYPGSPRVVDGVPVPESIG